MSVGVVAIAADDKYTSKYDNVDIDQVLKSERLLKNYMECLMERGPCTADAKELRDNLPGALKLDCSKCTDKQKEISKKVIRFLAKNKRAMFDELTKKYDPDGTYVKKYKDELAKEGITV
ncbi:hypothetical protein JTB14_007416 [Gonioctena quinquepunctata]|nr:hypothetical protein JTB14_007416 [Gonioctena quinquepunctata]